MIKKIRLLRAFVEIIGALISDDETDVMRGATALILLLVDSGMTWSDACKQAQERLERLARRVERSMY